MIHIRVNHLIDGIHDQPLSDVIISIGDDKIVQVCPAEEFLGSKSLDGWSNSSNRSIVAPTDPVIEVTDCTILPGMIDAHVHLCFTPYNDNAAVIQSIIEADFDQLKDVALRHAQQALATGVTTLRDCGDKSYVTLSLRQMINEGLAVGPRIIACGIPLTCQDGHLHFCGGAIDGSQSSIVAAVDERIRRDADFIKVMVNGGLMTPGSHPRQKQFDRHQLKWIVESGLKHDRYTVGHVLTGESIADAMAAGVRTLEHCTWLSPEGGERFDLDLVREMAEKGVYWSNTLSGVYRALLTGQSNELASQDNAIRWLGHFRTMYQEGVPMLISSDAGVVNTHFDDFPSSLKVAVEWMGLRPIDAIKAATSVPARALGLTDIGTIKPGMQADLLCVQGNPAEDINHLTNVRFVMKGGQIVADVNGLREQASPL